MKKFLFLVFLLSFLYGSEWCPICGNDLALHQATSHKAKLHNDRERHYCSLRCLVVDSQEYGIKDIDVWDYQNKSFIDANRSFYVVGSSLKGVNSKVSKVAFATHQDAKIFIQA
ncbi:MAG: nitrous oxide reductase accessory protein NosL, partial [Campylobacterales bacterium]|nr:nitrous oxide reductase accessory protein NosL [Campylobacterales bacterium]